MKLVGKLLNLPSTVAIGSSALGVPYEDIDVAVLREELNLLNMVLIPTNTAKYGVDTSPILTKSELYQVNDIDIFVFDNKDRDALFAVHRTMSSMQQWPKLLLRNKWFRIKLFRYYLRKWEF